MLRARSRSSRLTRTSEKQNKRQALFFTIGIVALIWVLLQFGPLLVNVFGNFVYTLRGGDKSDTQVVGKELLQPPNLIGLPEATQSATISFSGGAPDKNGIVEIYVNNDLKDEIEIKDKTDFDVKALRLFKGSNIVKARFIQGNKTSSFTQDFEVNYISDKPTLTVSFPNDGATYQKADKNITVTGITDPDNSVLVNSFRAIVDTTGKFSYLLQLSDGENQITIVAQNPAGTSTQKQIKVTFQP